MAESGLVYISGKEWPKFKEDMERLKGVFGASADNALAYIGSEGRRLIGVEEEREFEFGATQTKWKRKGEPIKKIRSHMDAKHGWYKASDDRRMIGFSFENALSYQRRTMRKLNGTMSQGYVYSLMANLWNNPTKPYSRPSAPFLKEGYARVGGWAKGRRRPARPGLSTQVVGRGVDKAMRRATQALERMIHEEGL